MNHVSLVTRRISALGLHASSSPSSSGCLQQLARTFAPLGAESVSQSVAYSRLASSHALANPLRRLGPSGADTRWETLETGPITGNIPISRKRHGITRSVYVRQFGSKGDGFGSLSENEYQEHPGKIKPISGADMIKIFGRSATRESKQQQLYRLLEILQKQRITGTLDHEIDDPEASEYLIDRGLQYLREEYPLDEDAAIIARIEREEKQAENEYIAAAERMRLYKPQDSTQSNNDVYGISELDLIRKENEAKRELEDEARAEAEAMANAEAELGQEGGRMEAAEAADSVDPNAIAVQTPGGRAVLAPPHQSPAWLKPFKEDARLSDHAEPPVMSKMQRILPSALFVVMTVGACIYLAENYEAPPRGARMFPDSPPAAATILTLIGINAAVWLFWKTPPLWRMLNRYALAIVATPKAVSMLGNVFSHQKVSHLIMNMSVLWFVGTKLHDEIGRGNFVAVYLASGVFGSLFSLTKSVLTGNLISCSLGASGAVAGVVACYLSLDPNTLLAPVFWPNDNAPSFPSIWALYGLLAFEVFGALRGVTRIDHFSHFGGYIVGIMASETLKYRARARALLRNGPQRKK